jgi:hypothetical protein
MNKAINNLEKNAIINILAYMSKLDGTITQGEKKYLDDVMNDIQINHQDIIKIDDWGKLISIITGMDPEKKLIFA